MSYNEFLFRDNTGVAQPLFLQSTRVGQRGVESRLPAIVSKLSENNRQKIIILVTEE